MDKTTRRALRQLDKLEKDLRACQTRLEEIGRARVPVYFGVSSNATDGFSLVYMGLEDMKNILRNHPEKIEG